MINTTRLPITTHFSASHKITKAQQKASADATAIDRACHAALEIMINHLFSALDTNDIKILLNYLDGIQLKRFTSNTLPTINTDKLSLPLAQIVLAIKDLMQQDLQYMKVLIMALDHKVALMQSVVRLAGNDSTVINRIISKFKIMRQDYKITIRQNQIHIQSHKITKSIIVSFPYLFSIYITREDGIVKQQLLSLNDHYIPIGNLYHSAHCATASAQILGKGMEGEVKRHKNPANNLLIKTLFTHIDIEIQERACQVMPYLQQLYLDIQGTKFADILIIPFMNRKQQLIMPEACGYVRLSTLKTEKVIEFGTLKIVLIKENLSLVTSEPDLMLQFLHLSTIEIFNYLLTQGFLLLDIKADNLLIHLETLKIVVIDMDGITHKTQLPLRETTLLNQIQQEQIHDHQEKIAVLPGRIEAVYASLGFCVNVAVAKDLYQPICRLHGEPLHMPHAMYAYNYMLVTLMTIAADGVLDVTAWFMLINFFKNTILKFKKTKTYCLELLSSSQFFNKDQYDRLNDGEYSLPYLFLCTINLPQELKDFCNDPSQSSVSITNLCERYKKISEQPVFLYGLLFSYSHLTVVDNSSRIPVLTVLLSDIVNYCFSCHDQQIVLQLLNCLHSVAIANGRAAFYIKNRDSKFLSHIIETVKLLLISQKNYSLERAFVQLFIVSLQFHPTCKKHFAEQVRELLKHFSVDRSAYMLAFTDNQIELSSTMSSDIKVILPTNVKHQVQYRKRIDGSTIVEAFMPTADGKQQLINSQRAPNQDILSTIMNVHIMCDDNPR